MIGVFVLVLVDVLDIDVVVVLAVNMDVALDGAVERLLESPI